MHYLSVENVSKSYVENPLFRDITFHVSQGDKVAIVARNGAGKSTLLRAICGLEPVDDGRITLHRDVQLCLLEQDPILNENETVLENIFSHRHPVIDVVKRYEAVTAAGDNSPELHDLMHRMDELNAWNFESTARQILGMLGIQNLQQQIRFLSGGQRKRLALAKVLIEISLGEGNHLLIWDEPTNHLDIDMIGWLADFLSDAKTTLLLVSHDRYFLDNVCTCIVEIENQQAYIHRGDYESYMERKVHREASERASFDKNSNAYRRELEWMRKQPKARTTKSKSRQDAFYEIEEQVKGKRVETPLELNMKMTRLGGKVLEMKKVHKSFGDLKILKGFDYTFKKGERIGIIGKNGCGKTTFLNMITGLETQDSGKINIGETIVFGYFSQSGLQVKEDLRVIEYVRGIAENFPLADGSKMSASQFLTLFQFEGDKQHTFISKLSGGEKKRLQLLALLFRNPNFLILDEPTNDLDLITLSVLEEFLEAFSGCIIIVSHDRYFMDKLVDHLFVFEGDGVVNDFPGNYTQYRVWKTMQDRKEKEGKQKPAVAATPVMQSEPVAKPQKMSFKEKREFEQLEVELPLLHQKKEAMNSDINSGSLHYEAMQMKVQQLAELTLLIDEKELRWLELSERNA